jgi:hypothetical protein
MLPGPVIMSTACPSAITRRSACPNAVGVSATEGEQRDGLSPADRPNLVDAEQRGGRENRGVRQSAELDLRWAGDHQGVHSGGLRWHHVHHDARRVHGIAARHVEAHAFDGYPTLGDRRTGGKRRSGVRAPLIGVHPPGAVDGHL